MKSPRRIVLVALLVEFSLSVPVVAELQNVEIGGSLEIYGAWYSEFFEKDDAPPRIPTTLLPFRAIGDNSTYSAVRASDQGDNLSYIEQRTRLYIYADFTDDVSAFVEWDSIDEWDEDLRSDYITGTDFRASNVDDVELYQAYIEAEEMFGIPLHIRVGRQEMVFGSGWLVGTNPDADPFTGLSFDAIRLTFFGNNYNVDVWGSKLAELFGAEEDGDTDFYGLYLTYTGIEDIEIDLYWMFLRDGMSVSATGLAPGYELLEELVGLDDYDVTKLNTVGVRSSGTRGSFDWEVEFAYQLGNAETVGVQFAPVLYGDENTSWNTWAASLEVGYTLDVAWEPWFYVGGGYYGGEDNRDANFLEWLFPFREPQASVSFNRLFSDYEVDAFLDGSALSNMWLARAGVIATPTDALEVGFDLLYQQVVAPFDVPVSFRLGRTRVALAPGLSFWDEEGAKDIGWQASLWAHYHYSETVHFEVGWTHFFVGSAIEDGSFIDENGLTFVGGVDDADADYIYVMTTIEFGGLHLQERARHRYRWTGPQD